MLPTGFINHFDSLGNWRLVKYRQIHLWMTSKFDISWFAAYAGVRQISGPHLGCLGASLSCVVEPDGSCV